MPAYSIPRKNNSRVKMKLIKTEKMDHQQTHINRILFRQKDIIPKERSEMQEGMKTNEMVNM